MFVHTRRTDLIAVEMKLSQASPIEGIPNTGEAQGTISGFENTADGAVMKVVCSRIGNLKNVILRFAITRSFQKTVRKGQAVVVHLDA